MFDGLDGGFRSRPDVYGEIISDCKTNGASQVSFRRRSIFEKIQIYQESVLVQDSLDEMK